MATDEADYVGNYHYRRMLDITEYDRGSMFQYQVDVVILFPMFHLPDIRGHYDRYVQEDFYLPEMIVTENKQ